MSLRLKRRGNVWYIRGTFLGQSIYASTKETDKAAAQRFKDQFEIQAARDGGFQHHTATFGAAAALYLDARPNIDRGMRRDIDRLCEAIGDTPLVEIKPHMVIELAHAICGELSAPTKNRTVIVPVSAVAHYAAENDLCPYVRFRKLKEKKPEPRWMRREDADRMIAAADPKMRRVLVFLFCQGWRISDVLRLRWEHVDFANGTAKYHIRKIDEWRSAPLHARVLAMLGAVPEAQRSGPVFGWTERGNFGHTLHRFCARIGVRFTPHMARHSFATWLVNDGATLPDIMEAGGWRDHKSVLRYARVNQERVRNVINKIRI